MSVTRLAGQLAVAELRLVENTARRPLIAIFTHLATSLTTASRQVELDAEQSVLLPPGMGFELNDANQAQAVWLEFD